jgi:hypothetical protein
MRPFLIPGHGEREILGFLRSGLNLPLSKFRQDQLSKGAVRPLLIPVYSPALDLLFPLDVDTHTLALRHSSRTDRCPDRLRENYVGTLELRWSARVAQQENTPAG